MGKRIRKSGEIGAGPAPRFGCEEERWLAVAARDKTADGAFFYSVRTTGVYCRPSCAARLARRENVRFHATAAEAERAGFRACKRCRPNQELSAKDHSEAIARACQQIVESEDQPDLASLASAAQLSPSHFHRAFKALTGLTPKAYATAHRAERAREALRPGSTVTSAIYEAGFNSNGRFYAASAKMLGMKPASYRDGGRGMRIRHAVADCSFGSILVAATQIGVCCVTLGDDPVELVKDLRRRFKNAEFLPGEEEFGKTVAAVVAFVERPASGLSLPLDVRGTAFQHRVWQRLCEIPCGETRSYAEVAAALGQPAATRAVAGACAANPIAVAIPCHRVVRSDGSLSGYRWGVERKARLLKIESQKPG